MTLCIGWKLKIWIPPLLGIAVAKNTWTMKTIVSLQIPQHHKNPRFTTLWHQNFNPWHGCLWNLLIFIFAQNSKSQK